jgi:hypothetical protein
MEATVKMPAEERRTNWGTVARVSVVGCLVLALVGYALKVTYESVIQGGVVNRGDYFDVELKAMSNFEMDQQKGTLADVPQRFRDLNGKKVLLIGEVAPLGNTAGDKAKEFQLCYSVAKCCFGGPPKVQHFVLCRSRDGKPMPNYLGVPQIKIFGTLHINPVHEGDAISSLFQMDIERIEPMS